ncbi:hypothetical protein AB0F25_29710 [Streptomyces wedmorensis]
MPDAECRVLVDAPDVRWDEAERCALPGMCDADLIAELSAVPEETAE